MFRVFIVLFLLIGGSLVAQDHPYPHFNVAYRHYPEIPRGLLEAISYTQTHVRHVMPNEAAGCSGIPQQVGIMGLIGDGKGVFRGNLGLVADLSGIPMLDIMTEPVWQIWAYARAYRVLNQQLGPFDAHNPAAHLPVLAALSELPLNTTDGADFALNSYFYSILSFLNNPAHAMEYRFPVYHIDLRQVFGANYDVLSSSHVVIGSQGITNGQGQPYSNSRRAAEYPGAIWNPAATCNYGSRSGTAITAVTVHTVQGSYAGCISWFQNCNAGVSAHYVIRSSDGQVTQMVPEANRAYHVGSENPYTVGIEHEGYINDPSWYTPAMYQSSANLVKYLAGKYTINPLSTYKGSAQVVLNSCYRIKGHIHYPNQSHTDPGTNWNWSLYHNLINDTMATTRLSACSGTFSDNGGTGGNYTDLTKYLTVIQPAGAASVTMSFTSFSLEQGYDSLYIYDGNGTGGTLIGRYTGTQNPGTVTANSGTMSLLFTSDCNTNSTGWAATWSCAACPGSLAVAVDSLLPVTCNPGYIRVAASGGTPPYSYVWGNGTPGPERTNMPVGAFTVSVTDGAGCTISQVFSIPSTPNPTVQLSHTNATCFGGNDATIAATGSAGTLPYSYAWNGGQSTATLNNASAGPYTVTITDGAGCTATASTVVTQPDSITILTDSLSDASCQGGYIAVSSSGGTGGHTYLWSDGHITAIRTGLNAGSYTVTATDASGCTANKGFSINSVSSIAIAAVVDTLTCPGDADAGIAITASGGNGPYTYLWSTGSTLPQIVNLTAGTYSVTATDALGCLASTTITVALPDSLIVNATISNITCFGDGNGSILLTPLSGTAPYQYQWSGAQAGSFLSNLAADTYTVTVTDARGCSITQTYEIAEPAPLLVWGVHETFDSLGLGWDSITGGTAPYVIETLECHILVSGMLGDPARICSLRVSDMHGCIMDSTYGFGVWQGVADLSAPQISIYPNPTNGFLYVEWDINQRFEKYGLLNALGQVLQQQELPYGTSTLQLDLSSHPAGSYWLLMDGAEGRKVLPIVKSGLSH